MSKHSLCGAILAVLIPLAGLCVSTQRAFAQTCDSINQWQPWEKTLTLTGTSSLGGNPYRDYILRVTFHNAFWGDFTQDAFWDNDPANLKNFKIRTALLAGGSGTPATWTWDTLACTTVTGAACPALTWSQSSGCITVQPVTTTGVKIYDNGFLKQYPVYYDQPNGTIALYSRPVYWNDTHFFWLGDTVWAAPPREISGQTTKWASYLAERRGRFTVLQIAPAVTWKPKLNPPEFTALPDAAGFSFDQTSCSSSDPIPNTCSKPKKSYWDQFDSLIAQANQQDLFVIVMGLIDPTDHGGDSGAPYPRVQDSKNFARYLTARLAGRAVIFSPGFDDRAGDLTKDGVSLSSALNQVGQAIKAAAPRHLVTNQLAGATTCSDYEAFRSQASWMTFFAFQSGHGGGNITSPAGTICGSPYPGEASVTSATRRSIQMPLTLAASANLPGLPSFNAEGPYDTVPAPSPLAPVDNRYRTRQVGYNSSLSNALGFTYGVINLGLWDNPLVSTFQTDSAKKDMAGLRLRFENRAPDLIAAHSWILNQQTPYDQKMALATDGSALVIAYLPKSTLNSGIAISTTGLSGLGCSWASRWYVPTESTSTGAFCNPGTNQISFSKPTCPAANPDCDWVLELVRGTTALASSPSSPLARRVEVWADPDPSDGTSAIRARLTETADQSTLASLTLSPAGFAEQQHPQVVPISKGFLVLWHANALDGSLLGVFGQRIDTDGNLVGPRTQLNLTTEENQRDPAAAADAFGNALVAWSSYGQDGDKGGIIARRVDPSGQPVGGEIQVNNRTAGHQERPQVVALPGGRFVIAWQTRTEEGNPGAVCLRLFDNSGRALTGEIDLPGQPGMLSRLVNLETSPAGGFHVDWSLSEPTQARPFLYSRSFNAAGAALGAVTQLP